MWNRLNSSVEVTSIDYWLRIKHNGNKIGFAEYQRNESPESYL